MKYTKEYVEQNKKSLRGADLKTDKIIRDGKKR